MGSNEEYTEIKITKDLEKFFDNLFAFKKYLFNLMNEKKDNTISEIYWKLDIFFKEKSK